MAELHPSENEKNVLERAWQFFRSVIAAHPALDEAGARRQAELLNAIALLLIVSSLLGFFASPKDATPLALMLATALGAFLMGKSKYARLGTYVFTFGFVTVAFLPLRTAGDYSALVLSTAPVTLIAASVLLSQRAFAFLILYASASAFLAPLYINVSIPSNEIVRNGGIIAAIGVVLYGVNHFRARMEEARAEEIRETHQKLQELRAELESRAKRYAQEMESAQAQIQKQTARLQTAAQVSQKILTNVSLSLKDLLTGVAEIISENLGFYHVGIFLVDKARGYAELFAANSEGGRRMLERRHQLKVGGTGIVGYVAQSGFPRIALSTGADAVFFNNPDLPNTQSEMALPLLRGSEVIGVLDVQSERPAAFGDEDLAAFNTLASQIAFAVSERIAAEQPARQEARASALQLEKDQRRGYSYLADGTIVSAKAVATSALEKALQLGEPVAAPVAPESPFSALAVPVKVRDSIVGYIHIEAAESGKKWTEDEILLAQAVAERAALALENARLFEEAERRAEQEQLMARIASRIAESNQFENILQTAVREIGQVLNAKRAYIQIETVLSDADEAAKRETE